MKVPPSLALAITTASIAFAACSGPASDPSTLAGSQSAAEAAANVLSPPSVAQTPIVLHPPPSPRGEPTPAGSPTAVGTPLYYLTSTSPDFNASASPPILTVAVNKAPMSFTVNSQIGFNDFQITALNSGSADCPVGAVALSEDNGSFSGTVTVAAYAPGHCLLSIVDPSTTLQLQLEIHALQTLGSMAPPGHIAGLFPEADGGGLAVQSWAAENPTEQSTLFVASGCATASGLARNTAGEVYIACQSVINEYAAGAAGSPSPIASVTVRDASGLGQLAIDHAGDVYVALPDASAVAEYSSDLATQLALLSGSETGLNRPVALAFGAGGNLYVYNAPLQAEQANTGSIEEFAPITPGKNNVAPVLALVTGNWSSCSDPWGSPALAVDARGDIFSSNDGGGLTEYAPGAAPVDASDDAPGSVNGFTLDGTRLYVSHSPYRGCLNQFTEPNMLGYFDVANSASTLVPFVTSVSGTSPQLITY